MTQKSLDVLKKALAKFSQKIKDRKDKLNAMLAQQETLSVADEQLNT